MRHLSIIKVNLFSTNLFRRKKWKNKNCKIKKKRRIKRETNVPKNYHNTQSLHHHTRSTLILRINELNTDWISRWGIHILRISDKNFRKDETYVIGNVSTQNFDFIIAFWMKILTSTSRKRISSIVHTPKQN